MQLSIFTKAALEQLKSDIYLNLREYANDEVWIDKYFLEKSMERYSRPTGILIPDFELIPGGADRDSENARIIYSNMREYVNPRIASDLRLWALLAHEDFYSYMVNRWAMDRGDNLDENVGDTLLHREYDRINLRYFFGASNGKAFVRQGISRLYWGAALTYDESNSDPFEMTDYIFASQDRFVAATERLLGRNKTFLLASLKVLKEADVSNRVDTRDYYAAINRACGNGVLESLSTQKAQDLCKNCLDRVMKLAVIKQDSKVRVKYIDSGKEILITAKSKGAVLGKTQLTTKPRSITGLRLGKRFFIGDSLVKVTDIINIH